MLLEDKDYTKKELIDSILLNSFCKSQSTAYRFIATNITSGNLIEMEGKKIKINSHYQILTENSQ